MKMMCVLSSVYGDILVGAQPGLPGLIPSVLQVQRVLSVTGLIDMGLRRLIKISVD